MCINVFPNCLQSAARYWPPILRRSRPFGCGGWTRHGDTGKRLHAWLSLPSITDLEAEVNHFFFLPLTATATSSLPASGFFRLFKLRCSTLRVGQGNTHDMGSVADSKNI